MTCKNCQKEMVPTLPCQGCGWKAGTPTCALWGSGPGYPDPTPEQIAADIAADPGFQAPAVASAPAPPAPESLGSKIKSALGL